MAWCLPQSFTNQFIKALQKGELDPTKMAGMTSEDRHNLLSKYVGEDNAKNVNVLYESKLLLKDQQQGMISWIKRTIKDSSTRSDLLSKVEKMDKILNPDDAKLFYKDLASSKLKADVTAEEAKQIYELSKKATEAKQLDQSVKSNRINYGNKFLDLQEFVDSLKPQKSPLSVTNIINLPKSALTSVLHFSATGVQLWGSMTTKEFAKGFVEQFKYFAKPQAYRDLQADIISHPDYTLAKDGKLGITHLGDQLNSREEAIQSSLLEHIPGVKIAIKASSRAFTGYINYVRFNRFVSLLNAARLRGEEVSKGSSVVRDIAKTVNDFTGRGALGVNDQFANAQGLLNNTFFSARKISAAMQMFNPQRYLDPRISPTARMDALRQLSGSIIATMTILKLAQMAGAQVETRSNATNFAKIKLGNSTLDPTGGNAIYIRLLARILPYLLTGQGQSISSTGRISQLGTNYGQQNPADLITTFFRDKLSPTASFIADKLYGKDPVGNVFDVKSEAYNKLIPIAIQDFINMARNDPGNPIPWVGDLAAIFGVGVESPTPTSSKTTDWGISTSKTLQQFHNFGGTAMFQAANQKFNSQYNTWVKQTTSNPSFKKLSQQEQQTLLTTGKTTIENKVLRSYGFKYHPSTLNRQTIKNLNPR